MLIYPSRYCTGSLTGILLLPVTFLCCQGSVRNCFCIKQLTCQHQWDVCRKYTSGEFFKLTYLLTIVVYSRHLKLPSLSDIRVLVGSFNYGIFVFPAKFTSNVSMVHRLIPPLCVSCEGMPWICWVIVSSAGLTPQVNLIGKDRGRHCDGTLPVSSHFGATAADVSHTPFCEWILLESNNTTAGLILHMSRQNLI